MPQKTLQFISSEEAQENEFSQNNVQEKNVSPVEQKNINLACAIIINAFSNELVKKNLSEAYVNYDLQETLQELEEYNSTNKSESTKNTLSINHSIFPAYDPNEEMCSLIKAQRECELKEKVDRFTKMDEHVLAYLDLLYYYELNKQENAPNLPLANIELDLVGKPHDESQESDIN
ncbi:MAG: hypothetical protein K0R02_83 [Rickettsiaceae bacterium]|jgi:hypothetical protein|nr:hypothetical protein [Rickettsiaceae bacterium]